MQGKLVEVLIVMLFVMNAISPVLGSIEQQETFSDEQSNKDYHESVFVNPSPLFTTGQSVHADTTMETVGTSSTSIPEDHEACCAMGGISTTGGTTSMIPNDWFFFNQGLNQPTIIIDTPADHSIHDTRNVKIHAHGTASSASCSVYKWQARIEYEDWSRYESGDLFFDEPFTSYWVEINPYYNWCDLKLGWNRITITVYDLCGKSASAQITITYQDISVPLVDITSPEDGGTFDDPHVSLVIKADEPGTIPCDGSGIKKISWIHTWEGGEARDEYVESAPYIPERTITRPITLKEGENTLHAWATDWAESQGDVFDEITVTFTPPPPPEILSITIKGPPGNESNPMTNHDVTFEADYTKPDGYRIYTMHWTIYDKTTGNLDCRDNNFRTITNPWVVKLPAEKYGKKEVTCILFYVSSFTGEIGWDKEKKDFNLFFAKKEDHDGDGEPNWFEFWKKDKAVPNMDSFTFDPAGGYGCFRSPATLELGPPACDIHYPTKYTIGGIAFGGAKGIDCAAEVCAHELYHKWVYDKWHDGWKGLHDRDGDELENEYENKTSKTDWKKSDMYNVAVIRHHAPYAGYGDQEWMAMKAGDGKQGVDEKDWANPGSQTNPPYAHTDVITSIKKASSLIKTSIASTGFTDTIVDYGTDTDGDGFYDYLTLVVDITIEYEGYYLIVGWLHDAVGHEIDLVNNLFYLDEGMNSVELNFQGLRIRSHGANGPYSVSFMLSNEDGDACEYQCDPYVTAPYDYREFEQKDVSFTGVYADKALDDDGDGFYDVLTVEVEFATVVQGEYTVDGYLYDSNEDPIVFARSTRSLDVGTQLMVLQFDGMNIAINMMNGPYTLCYLTLSDEDNEHIDYLYKAYETTPYQYDDFITQNFTTQPDKPERPSGDTEGQPGVAYTFETMTTDQDGDTVWYLWDWGDGNTSDWLGPYTSGATCSANYSWNAKGTYDIKVKARDLFGISSSWSDPLAIKMPHSNTRLIPHFFEVLFQRFPHAFPLLRQLMGY